MNDDKDHPLDSADENENRVPESQYPDSPHSIAPQMQDEEAEKEETALMGAGIHPEAGDEEVLESDPTADRALSEPVVEEKNIDKEMKGATWPKKRKMSKKSRRKRRK